MKLLSKSTIFLLAALVLSLVSFPPAPAAAEGDFLDISADTVWEGEVSVSGEVRVQRGATLLLLPGTTVRFSAGKDEQGTPAARLFVMGTLIAQGTPDRPVLFTSSAREPQPGDWGGIILERANENPNRLRHVRVEYATAGLSGAYSFLLAEETEFRRNTAGVRALLDFRGGALGSTFTENEVGVYYHQSSKFNLEHCEIRGNSGAGISCYLSSSPVIRHCTIADNGPAGVLCFQGSSPLVESNTVSGHERGIYIELQARPTIVRNAIVENQTGIWGEKMVFPKIIGNLIAGNGTGIYCNYSAYPEIHGNSITGNEQFGLVLGDNMSAEMEKLIPFRSMGRFYFQEPPEEAKTFPQQSKRFTPFPEGEDGIVDARGNWWGEEATKEMEAAGEEGNVSVIEDFHDKPDTWYQDKIYPRDRVAFSPWEKEPPAEVGPVEAARSGVRGKVISNGKPLGGVRVHAYREAGISFGRAGLSYSAPSAADGTYSLTLSPGTYFLVAKGPDPPFPHLEPGPGALYGYYGGNPVTVTDGSMRECNIQVVARKPVAVEEDESASKALLEGTVVGPDGPLEGALVHVYADAERQFRGPDLFGPQGAVVGGTGEEGEFSVEMPPGNYYLVASKRLSGGMLGPLRPGDLHGYFDGNPLALEKGTRVSVTIQVVEKLRDTEEPAAAGAGSTGIRGTIRDASGSVPPGVYAYATTDPRFMIGTMPPYRSQPLEKDGSFYIDLPEGSTYYVGARSGYGGPPLPGEWHGFYGGEVPEAVKVETGKVTENVDFVVKRME